MKRFLTAVMAIIMTAALVSCGGSTKNSKSLLDIGDFSYQFKDYELVKDAYGSDVILLCYDFTNKSEDDCAFFASGFYEAVQAGETLNSTTIYVSEESMEAVTDAEMEEIAPGETLEVKIAYELIDTTSSVTVNFASISTGKEASHTINITAPVSQTAPSSTDTSDEGDSNINEGAKVEAIGELGDSEWYGWWMVDDATGDFEDVDGAYFDCCANFEPTDEGYTLLSIWDEEFTDYNNNCIGEIYLEYYDDLGYSSVGGYFLTGEDIASNGEVMVIPDVTDIDNTLFITIPVETEDGGFTANLFLTEWGYEWDEELAEYPTYYDSYFLPLMEDGKALPANLDDIG